MKVNMPVTNNEVYMEEGKPIISKTNLKGQIIAINRAFLEISGFTTEELINSQHNIVRHPDMPAAAFLDLWETAKQGKPWKGIVKNRVKNGDYYWVYAQVTPVKRNGAVTEYMSVRRVPTKEQINEAEALYSQLNANKTPSVSIIQKIKTFLGNATLTTKSLMLITGLSGVFAASHLFLGGLESTILSFIITAIALYSFISSAVKAPLKEFKRVIDLVAEGNFDSEIEISRNDEVGHVYQALQSMQLILDYNMEDANFKAEEAIRISNALQVCQANVMMADSDLNIIYMNTALMSMLRSREKELQEILPNFIVDNLIGTCVDDFHVNPDHQRGIINKLVDIYKTEIQLGRMTFSLIATPVFNDSGERLGTVVEWSDRTDEVAIEQEIDNLVSSAVAGDLTQRIDTESKSGFFETLGTGLNKLVTVSDEVVANAADVLEAMSHGDLTKSMSGEYDGSFAKLQNDTNLTVNKLTEIITEIRTSASSVASGAQEISGGNLDLSQRTEEQASSLEETAASMEEMTSSVRQSADNAKNASDLATEAQKKAESGGEVVGRAVDAMEEINESSNKISDIIGVIDEIAFQTNLLALNAAVEAARAGEQGRGFAVVAAEVRNLAQRSAGAAKEIKELIRDSVGKVEDGSKLVNESGKTLTQIVEAVQQVSTIINEISSSSQEQSDGIDQVNTAVSQMDEATQQNAALVEEASAASENMAEQAGLMNELMDFFTTDNSPKATVVHTPAEAVNNDAKANTASPKKVVKPDNQDGGWEEF